MAKDGTVVEAMRVNVGQAKSTLSQLIARVEAGEEVEIARNGTPVVRLVPVEPMTAGQRLLAARGSLRGQIWMSDDFELSEEELDQIYDNPIDPR